jgi:O-antigen ligase
LIVLATLGAGLARLREHKRIVLAAAVLAAGVWFALAPARQLTGGGLASATRFSQQLLANVSGRFDGQQVGDNLSSRWKVNRAVLAMAADRWATGMGAGTFALAFPYYQPRSIPGFFLHAHNEYLQGLVEIGVLGMALFAWMAYGMFARRVAATAHEGLARWEYWGLMLALGGLSVHALTDFPLRLPAVSLLAASLIGMGGGVSRGDSPLPSNHE